LLAKISQNLELLRLSGFLIGPTNEEESVTKFHFSDSILDLLLDSILIPELATRLPRFVEHVKLVLKPEKSTDLATFPTSILPPTLRTFSATFNLGKFTFDSPLPPHLEKWVAQMEWGSLPPNFIFPNSLQSINGSTTKTFGEHFERVPTSYTALNASQKQLEPIDVQNFPPSLAKLQLDQCGVNVLPILPKTLKSLTLTGMEAGVLKKDICERLEALHELDCYMIHLESITCLGAFKFLKKLHLAVYDVESLADSVFPPFISPFLETVNLEVLTTCCKQWPFWILQFKEHPSIRKLKCFLHYVDDGSANSQENEDFEIPKHLKCLPIRIESLWIPPPLLPRTQESALPIISSPEFIDCFRHFPSTLRELTFAETDPINNEELPLWLSDDCFTHLPPSLTHLQLQNVCGLTDHFWDIIPPDIMSVEITSPFEFWSDSFYKRRDEYLAKFEDKQ
jgi:hypothetical protein